MKLLSDGLKALEASSVCLLSLILASCGESDSPAGESYGMIDLQPGVDCTVVASAQTRSQLNDITADDLKLTIASTDGTTVRTFANLSEFNRDERFRVGAYTFTATYGSAESEGFGAPYYYGSTNFSVTDGATSQVSVTATLANAMITVEATDAFVNYFTEYSSTLHSSGGGYFDVASGETRPVYVRPGAVTMVVKVKAPNGKELELNVADFTAEARHHYILTLDTDASAGDAALIVAFDEMIAKQDVNILLTAELMNAPAPTAECVGNATTEVVQGAHGDGDLRFDAISKAGMAKAMLTTSAPALLAAGWPAEVDLCSISSADRAVMEGLGAELYGFSPGATMATINLTELVPNLTDANNLFTLAVTDRMGKISDPVSAAVKVTPMSLSFVSIEPVKLLSTEMTANIAYNGVNPEKLQFTITNAKSEAVNAPLISITKTADGKYAAKLSIPADGFSHRLTASLPGGAGTTAVTFNRVAPTMTLSTTNGLVWATHASFTLACSDASAEDLAKQSTVYLSTAGSAYKAVNATVSGAQFTIEGLSAATTYSVKVSAIGNASVATEPLTFTTETAAAVPNGDFEQLTATIDYLIYQGGTWTITAGGTRYHTQTQWLISEPNGWASTNAKTCNLNASNLDTWYVQPSVYNTSLTWISKQPAARFIHGQDAYDIVPDIYAYLEVQSGANAMVVRNVAWDAAGEEIPNQNQTGNLSCSNYYNPNVPSQWAHRSAGKLFLGTYSFDGSNETINEGVGFTSRPSTLTGYYKFDNDEQDPDEYGVVSVRLLNGTRVIATGTAHLTATTGEYCQFSIDLDYVVKNSRPTTLKIMITSSNHTSEADIRTTTYVGKPECCSRGAALTIDNLKFKY
jgi:hypothetical protein